MVGVADLERSRLFYDAVLGALGHNRGFYDDRGRVLYVAAGGIFALTRPINGEPASVANGNTIGLAAATPDHADAWHAAGLANGGTACEDPPGWRNVPAGHLYLAYLRDPDGHKLCASHRPRA